jgi:hypothetical protein
MVQKYLPEKTMSHAALNSLPVSFRKCVTVLIGAELFIVLIGVGTDGISLEALQTITRFSGRLSLLIFSIIFLFRRQVLANILSEHYYLIFAIVHGIHLTSYLWLSHATIIPYRLAGGALAYLFIFAMPWIHDSFLQNRISDKVYKISEQVYAYYVWFIFFMTYLPRVLGKLPQAGGTFMEHVTLMTIVCGLLITRMVLQLRRQTNR